MNASDDGNDNDFDNIKENDYDKDFEKFKKISAHEPSQVFITFSQYFLCKLIKAVLVIYLLYQYTLINNSIKINNKIK